MNALWGESMMKTLLVLRHAQALHAGDIADHERPLTKQGVREARRIGRLLRGLRPESALCSTALRARSTLEHSLSVAQLKPDVQQLEQLYDSDVERHLAAVRLVNAPVERLLLVGHNPSLESLVSQLVRRPITMQTGSLAVVSLALQSWQSLESSIQGTLVGLFDPAMLKKKVSDAPT
jgi:phosphohistidine phosphatase